VSTVHVADSSGYDPFVPADDGVHSQGSHPWTTETWWFSFFVPDRGLGGWLYALLRPNQSTSAGGLWVWDGSGSQPRDARYFAHYTSLPTRPARLVLPRLSFPSGFEIEVRESGRRYGLAFADPDSQVSLDLEFVATMPAVGHANRMPPFEESSHFDQAGRVTGRLSLDGEEIAVDAYAFRDRSWGLRSERVAPEFSYCWKADASEAFLVYAPRVDGPLAISRGILYRDGVARPITSGLRSEVRDPAHGWVTSLTVTAVDDLGRGIEAHAEAVSRLVHPRPTSANTISVLSWSDAAGRSWGEDQDVWPHRAWRRRNRRPDAS
jgi:hypothetical protein